MTVKILLLKSGEDVIADVKEMVSPDEKVIGYFLNKPCVVKLIPKDSDDESRKETAMLRVELAIDFIPSSQFAVSEDEVQQPHQARGS